MSKRIFPSNRIFIGESEGKSRGVFARRNIPEDSLIEQCPVLVIPNEQKAQLDGTAIYDYYFAWDKKHCSIPLGFGGLYNHSYSPNALYQINAKAQTINFISLREILEGEEITVNYNGSPQDNSPLWPMKSGGQWV